MTIKYKANNGSWAYIEAKYVSVSRFPAPHDGKDEACTPDEALKKIEKRYQEINSLISSRVGIGAENICYLLNVPAYQVDYFTVVVASDNPEIGLLVTEKEAPCAYVLNTEAYLLNENGRTIERISS